MGADTDFLPIPADSGMTWHVPPLRSAAASDAPACAAAPPTAARGWRPATVAARCSVKAVLFDVEDVLYDGSAWYRWLAQIFARAAQRTLEAEFTHRWYDEFLPAVHRGDRTFFMAFAECLSGLGLSTAHVDEIVAAGRAQRRHQEATLRSLPGARTMLAGLQAAGVAVGILTNTDRTADALASDLGRLGLTNSFACLLTSFDMRTCLPDKDCYAAALTAIDEMPAEVVFVGHQGRDIAGAQTAGLQAIAFNVRQKITCAAQVDRLEEVLDYVMSSAAASPAEPQTV